MPDRRRKRPRDPAQLAKLMIDIASATAIRLILKRSKARSAATSTMRCWSKYMSRLAKAKNATVPRDSLFQSRPVAIGAATSTMAAMKAADFQMLHAEDKTTGDLTTAMLSQNFEKSWSSQTQQRTRLNLRNLNSLFNRENSLFLEKNSLIRVCKFPVPLRREFGCKLLNPRVDQTRKSRWMAGFCKIPC